MSAPTHGSRLLLVLIAACVFVFCLVEFFGGALHLSRTSQHYVGMTAFVVFLGLLATYLRNRKSKQ